MDFSFDFEQPIVALEKKLKDLKSLSNESGAHPELDFREEIKTLEKKLSLLFDEVFSKISPWQRIQLSRHPARPYALDYIEKVFTEFTELHGDRCFGDDAAIVGGVARFEGTPVLIIGQQKGRTTKQKIERNFGMARPEGYRKAIRLLDMADRLKLPVITLIDTPGAYPGADAESRGQATAIAESIQKMCNLSSPSISVVLGEGGSGGALAIGVTDRVLMFEYSYYSVISPESCASILWSDSSFAERASECLKIQAPELMRIGVVDDVIPEPKGGAHRDLDLSAANLRVCLKKHFDEVMKQKNSKASRYEKFRKMGEFSIAKI